MNKWGSLPMNGQISCEGPMGKTTLKDAPREPFCRDLAAAKAEWEKKKNEKK